MGNISITQNGKPLDKSKYTIDLKNKTFCTKENDLVIELREINWIFYTGSYCTFITGARCTFKTYSNCTFTTGISCTFTTGIDCTFKTAEYCIFMTGSKCTFVTGDYCTFNTFDLCTFKTGKLCTFSLYNINNCKFKSYDGMSTILDREDKQHYILTKALINMLKVING